MVFRYKTTKGQVQTNANRLLADMRDTIKDLGRELWETNPFDGIDWEADYRLFLQRHHDEDLQRIFIAFLNIHTPRTKQRDREAYVALILATTPEARRTAILATKRLSRVRRYDQ